MTDVAQHGTVEQGQASFRSVGKPLPRNEDERLITGRGRFSDDFAFRGQAYAAMVRSPHPHARIRGIDSARAKAMPGVLGVFTGADCLADRLGADPARSAAEDQIRHEAARPRAAATSSSARTCCCRPTRRAMSAKRSRWWSPKPRPRRWTPPKPSRSITRSCPSSITPRTRCSPARRPCGTRRPTTSPVDTFVRRPCRHRQGFRRRRSCGRDGFPHRPRHRRDHRAARRARALRRGDRPLHALCRQRRRGAAEERAVDGARHPAREPARAVLRRRRQLRHPQPRVRRVRPGAVGRQEARPAGEIHRHPLGEPSSPTTRAAISSPASSWRCARTATSSPCARPTSAISARAACRSRRCRKARA